jgi:hypothetical protein
VVIVVYLILVKHVGMGDPKVMVMNGRHDLIIDAADIDRRKIDQGNHVHRRQYEFHGRGGLSAVVKMTFGVDFVFVGRKRRSDRRCRRRYRLDHARRGRPGSQLGAPTPVNGCFARRERLAAVCSRR